MSELSREHVIPSLGGSASKKSCEDCIFFHNYSECMKFGKPIVPADATPKQGKYIVRATAENCSSYKTGKDSPAEYPVAGTNKAPVFIPLTSKTEASNYERASVNSCEQCRFFVVGGADPLEASGFSNACAARGIVMKSNENYSVAQHCDVKIFSSYPDYSILDIKNNAYKIPLFDLNHVDKLIAQDDNGGERLPFKDNFNPEVVETSAPVSDANKKDGIRAWFRVHDPKGTGNYVTIPVFDRGFFSEYEQAKIPSIRDEERPQDYIDHQGLIYKILVQWMELDETPALIGPAGTGKTEVMRTLAWLMQIPFERISITASTELDDIQGKMLFVDNETRFQYGRLTAAWMKPNVICLDEPNVGPPEVWQFIRPLTDNSKQLVVDANSGERIYRNNYCFLGLAMNPAWDIKNIGADMISDADGSRLIHIETVLPPRDIEETIITKRCARDGFNIHQVQLDMIYNIAKDIRSLVSSGELNISWGIRSQIKVARLLKWFDVEEAYRMAAVDSLEPSARDMILDLVKSRSGNLARQVQAYENKKAMVPKPPAPSQPKQPRKTSKNPLSSAASVGTHLTPPKPPPSAPVINQNLTGGGGGFPKDDKEAQEIMELLQKLKSDPN